MELFYEYVFVLKKEVKMRIHTLIIALVFLAFPSNAQPRYELKSVTVTSSRQADTVFGTWKFSVSDYEFLDDRMILLAYGRNLEDARIVLLDESQKVIASVDLPQEAKSLYRDYQGFINVICARAIYRITIKNEKITLGSLPVNEYRRFIMPCIDTLKSNLYFSNYDRNYPEFTYYAYNGEDSLLTSLRTVTDQEVLKGYNMEYYFLKPKERIQAIKMADDFGIDKHRIAAAMSGLTSSMYYTPLYAPLFIMNDTAVVFDHYSNAIIKYDRYHKKVDSVHIDYNHPKAWREWKHQVLVDKAYNDSYAVYEKGGYYHLKHIDLKTGKIKGSYKLLNQYVDNLKVRNGYVYYVYRPFESLQEFFVYRELITY
jgi:hypothetical protein